MDIKAAVIYNTSEKFKIETLEISEPLDNEVLVKNIGVGICHTDLAARDQHFPAPLPAVFGHESSGIVEKVGANVTKVKAGDHVVLSWDHCGKCSSCNSGIYYCCENFLYQNFKGVRADGSTTLKSGTQPIHGSFFNQSSFANYSLANESNVVKVNSEIPLNFLGPLGCGVQTGAGAVINTFSPPSGSSIAIFGAGSVGISAILASVLCECNPIIAIDINPTRLKIAKELGATHTINAKDSNVIEEIKKINPQGVNYSLECVGNSDVLQQAVESLAICGTCGLVGVAPAGASVTLSMDTILNGRTIKGIVEGDSIPDKFIPELINLYTLGKFPFDKIIKFYPFEDINKAVEDMEKGLVVKPVLTF